MKLHPSCASALRPLALVVALWRCAALAAAAEAPLSPSDPADPDAAVPAVPYRSGLAGYHAFSEDAVTPWRQANEAAAGFGGWRAYAREPIHAQPEGAAPAMPTASEPGTAPHVHHRSTP